MHIVCVVSFPFLLRRWYGWLVERTTTIHSCTGYNTKTTRQRTFTSSSIVSRTPEVAICPRSARSCSSTSRWLNSHCQSAGNGRTSRVNPLVRLSWQRLEWKLPRLRQNNRYRYSYGWTKPTGARANETTVLHVRRAITTDARIAWVARRSDDVHRGALSFQELAPLYLFCKN